MTDKEIREFAAIYHHKFVVLQFLNAMVQDLIKRGETHDNTKFTEDEFPDVVAAIDELKQFPYGSPEYEEVRKKWWHGFEKHYKKNRHHPEFFENGILDMDLVDIIELLVDWKAASMRTGNGGDFEKSIQIGAARYNIHPDLVKIFMNTARNYKMLDNRR